MKKLFPKPRHKAKRLFPKPLLTDKDPGHRGLKHLKAIQNEEGFYHQ